VTKPIIDVTAAIIVKDGKVLVVRRGPGKHLEGYWEFPGGKLEENETPEDCLERELTEEFSIGSRVGAYIGESIYDYGEKVVRLLGYEVQHTAGDFKLVDHDEIRWLEIDQLADMKWAPADIPLVEQYEAIAATEAYYTANAQAYCDETRAFDVGDLYRPFLDQLADDAHILELGCGSGRDSKAFMDEGYLVTPVDGNAEVAACAEQYLGRPVAVTTFQTLDYHKAFDGVWASASLLHCPRPQLPDALTRISQALKDGGVAYLSFKWGDGDSVDDGGRHFTNFTEDSLTGLLGVLTDFTVIKIWTETKPLRDGEQKWVNALVRKAAR